MGSREYDLGSAELEVMAALWELGPTTVREVMEFLHEEGREVAYTTVLTFLTRLDKKGYVKTDKAELAHVYRAAISRTQVRRSRLKQLLNQLYDGVPGPLALQLVRGGRFTREEVEELRTLIDRLDS